MGHREVDERNRDSLDRLRAAATRLSEDELLRPIDPPWTASALFAHIAFWDRFAHARWRHAVDTGTGTPAPIDDEPLELINDAGLPEWTALPAPIAIQECMAAAEGVNGLIEALEAETVRDIAGSERHRLVDRSVHRGEHLKTIESAFPAR
jgi:hypothetical protein